MTVAMGLYFFVIAFVLAQLEIQIEGAHGWAARLPTWQWAGKPITGYHVFLMTFILLFVHLPMVYLGFSLEREAELLSLFFMLAVFWDFLWFVCNPHFGLAQFRADRVWWFRSWTLGLPTCYFSGLVLSLAIYSTTVLLPGGAPWPDRLVRWGTVLGMFLVPTLLTLAGVSIASRRKIVPAPAND
jgi:hypothetical protein